MTVWLALRADSWYHALVEWFFPPHREDRAAQTTRHRIARVVYPLLASCPVAARSWMHVALVFTVPCARTATTACLHCHTRPSLGYHTLMVDVHSRSGLQLRLLESVFPDPASVADDWLFVRLDRVADKACDAYFRPLAHPPRPFNWDAFNNNFWPWSTPRGVQRDNQVPRDAPVMCSEVVTAFLQSKGLYDQLGLLPCATSPQQLATALFARYPKLLAEQQCLRADVKAPLVTLQNRLFRIRKD